MATKLTDYLNAINHSKSPLMDTEDESVEKGYVPFLVNRCLSYFPDTILQANEMNRYGSIRKKMQFDFLTHSIRARKRFSKWMKIGEEENLSAVKERYGCSDIKAKEILRVLTTEQIESVRLSVQKGGS
jgi:Bacteriophage clamp loader A subunit